MHRVLITSSSAAQRLHLAREWLTSRAADAEILVLGDGFEGAFDLTRAEGLNRGALFGWHHLSLHRLSLRLAEKSLSQQQLTPMSSLTVEALWTRVVHELAAGGNLGRFQPVSIRPGLPRALARTVDELRVCGVATDRLEPDLARVVTAFEVALAESRLADRAMVLRFAIEEFAHRTHPLAGLPILFLDVAIRSSLEAQLVQALVTHAPEVFATVPRGDDRTITSLERALHVEPSRSERPRTSGIERLQHHLFSTEQPPLDQPADDVELISAPGEFRECVELVRTIHREIARGVPLDRMAVLLRAPGAYRSPICEALRRASIPAYFARGSRQPDPAGRALLSLLACADEELSARHFNEYLSLGEVPPATAAGTPPDAPAAGDRWAPPDVEAETPADEAQHAPEPPADGEDVDETAPVVAGTLRAPRRWELLVVEAAVIGGEDRWRRRLAALEERYRLELSAPGVSEANAARITRSLSDLQAFTTYALPLIQQLAALPARAPWSEWLDRIGELATRSLRNPSRVLGVLAELAPLRSVGPVTLAEVRTVLTERMRDLTTPPPKRRYGCVFVGPVEAARGMTFDVVLIPGLAERVFPQKVREDPVLPDSERRSLDAGLETNADRVASERLQLQLAVGAATRRVVLSYPRLDSADGRPRVPSFYGLEALRSVTGKLPRYEALQRRAERAVDARIGWPAPRDAGSAIDVVERDLSTLDSLFRHAGPVPRGTARYLTQVNPSLARALRMRYARFHNAWTQADGLVKPSADAFAALARHQLSARAFSATALQHFAACPYRFFLSAILGLSPWEEPVALEELDPLQKGSMMHEVYYTILSQLEGEGRLPLRPTDLEYALAQVDQVLEHVARKHEELYAPAIERVWQDGVIAMRADAREWLRRMVSAPEWIPWKFELAFGLSHREQQDPESRPAPVELDGGLKFRGSIDLVERNGEGTLRATDYKTGKARATPGTVIGGGKMFQPVLYALALEKLFPGVRVEGGRLYYSTQAGAFTDVDVPLDEEGRQAARRALGIVGQALEKGFLPAAPAKDECTWCDYQTVCGAGEEKRVEVKPGKLLEGLRTLREMK